MAVSVDYVVRETASNLWRNRLMTIAAVLTVAVSLSLVGAALLLRQGSANATGTWSGAPRSRSGWSPCLRPGDRGGQDRAVPANYVDPAVRHWNKARNFSEAGRLLPSDVFQATTEERRRPLIGARPLR